MRRLLGGSVLANARVVGEPIAGPEFWRHGLLKRSNENRDRDSKPLPERLFGGRGAASKFLKTTQISGGRHARGRLQPIDAGRTRDSDGQSVPALLASGSAIERDARTGRDACPVAAVKRGAGCGSRHCREGRHRARVLPPPGGAAV